MFGLIGSLRLNGVHIADVGCMYELADSNELTLLNRRYVSVDFADDEALARVIEEHLAGRGLDANSNSSRKHRARRRAKYDR